jgi:hypothetical protein
VSAGERSASPGYHWGSRRPRRRDEAGEDTAEPLSSTTHDLALDQHRVDGLDQRGSRELPIIEIICSPARRQRGTIVYYSNGQLLSGLRPMRASPAWRGRERYEVHLKYAYRRALYCSGQHAEGDIPRTEQLDPCFASNDRAARRAGGWTTHKPGSAARYSRRARRTRMR